MSDKSGADNLLNSLIQQSVVTNDRSVTPRCKGVVWGKHFNPNFSIFVNAIKEQIMQTYRIILNPEPEGGYTVTVPSLPGCVTYGENVEHALDMAKEAIEGYITVMKEQGKEIPNDNNSLEYSLTLAS
ncbi:MAG TPA: type II toxin-antitoxin system HicB family antitoxin [Prolixibacteraceae bacterium]|nr:type II toxin-antitoxin system HicB family antitoxin [Prolixibacteraceae bacterium]HPS11878.1 type II toxin-antitoxin system HicB family antitoxin [Prolixibacteraceae bacterium]